MKKTSFILLAALSFCTFFSCNWGLQSKEDCEIFVNTEPLEWSDDFVFSASVIPSSIQIWDSKTNRLVKNISLEKDERALTIYSMEVLEKSVWIIGVGKKTNLIRIDIESGNFEYKDFSFDGYKSRPYHIKAVSKEEDGVGTLWVKSYGNAKNGTLFAAFNSDGTLRESFPIECDISGSEMNVVFVDGKYYMLCSSISNYLNPQNNEQYGYNLVNLTDKKIIPIKNEEIFSNGLFNMLYECESITEILSLPNFYKENFMVVSVVSPYMEELGNSICSRLYYKVKSYEPFDVEYLGIRIDDASASGFYENNSNYYIFTDSLKREIDTVGITINMFDKLTSDSKKIFIRDSNQTFIQHKNNATWISMDGYKYAGNWEYNKTFIPEICKFEHETGKVFVYSEDGTGRELFWDE